MWIGYNLNTNRNGMLGMKWNKVRTLYPDQFVKFEIVESHVNDNKEYVDEVAIIKAIPNGKDAIKEFVNCKEG